MIFAAVLGVGLTSANSAHADEGVGAHRVTYTVTVDQPTSVAIYFRDVEPPTWADYSHDPYQFSPRDDVELAPERPWVRDVTLGDPMKWAMVTVTTAGLAPANPQTLRCELAVDGIVVKRAAGAKGALCSLRTW